MKISVFLGLFVLLLLSGCGGGETTSGTPTAAGLYSVTNLGQLVSGAAFNNRGEVVSGIATPDGDYNLKIYRDGQWTPLNIEGSNVITTGFTDSGIIVGKRRFRAGQGWIYKPFVYRNGVAEDFPVDENLPWFEIRISTADEILLEVPAKPTVFFRQGGQQEMLLSPYAANSAGQVVGIGQRDFVPRLWQNGVVTTLPTLPESPKAIATDINEQGIIVGYAHPHDEEGTKAQAVMWKNGEIIRLGTFAGGASRAGSINSRGEITGASRTDICPAREGGGGGGGRGRDHIPYCEEHGFLYKNGVMTDINTLISPRHNIVLKAASGINDKGEILAVGNHVGNNNEQLLFLLRPST